MSTLRRLPRITLFTVIGLLALAIGSVFYRPHADRSRGFDGDFRLVETTVTSVAAPLVRAPSAVLVDAVSGQVLFAKNAHERRVPASVTKVMTLAVVMDALRKGQADLRDEVVTSYLAYNMEGTTMFLEQGEVAPLEEILYGVAVASANDASVALAEHIGGSVEGFAELMNAKARELGMKDSHFSNPHGLPSKVPHYTSTYDLALLSVHLVNEYPGLMKYVSTWEHWREKGGKKFWLTNFNRGLVEYPGMDGLKTGWTDEAGFCLAATAKRGARRLVAVVMGSPSPKERNEDIYGLMDWGFGTFDTILVADKDQPLGRVRVWKGTVQEIDVVPRERVAVTVPKGQKGQIKRSVEMKPSVIAPVTAQEPLGEILVLSGNTETRRIPLIATGDVPRAGLPRLFARYWRGLWVPPRPANSASPIGG